MIDLSVQVMLEVVSLLSSTDFAPLCVRGVGLAVFLPLGLTVAAPLQKLVIAIGLALCGARFEPTEFSIEGACFELVLGSAIALPVTLSVGAAEMFGELFDSGRGQTIAASYAPLTDSVVSPMATFCLYSWWAVFLLSGCLTTLVVIFFESVAIYPPGSIKGELLTEIGARSLPLIARMLTASLQLFLPFGILFLIAELCFGFLSRLLPTHSFFGEAFLFKTVCGTLALIALDRAGILSSIGASVSATRIVSHG